MNMYTLACRLKKRAEKNGDLEGRNKAAQTGRRADTQQFVKEQIEANKQMEINNFKENFRFACELAIEAKKIMEETGLRGTNTMTYFVTIRPANGKILFKDFYSKIESYLASRSFINWTCTFEQKGTSLDTIGSGFHTHMWISTANIRSKGEMLRKTTGTYDEEKKCWKNGALAKWLNNGIIDYNCIQVDICQNANAMIKNYAIEYESKDGHKIVTKQYDEIWRQEYNLQNLYTSETGLPPIKSGVVGHQKSTEDTIKVSFE